ncbi:MAG: TIGR01212 family radical SAM protein [Treponema sp.]|nr:TIGR01212 family radical SAM protein [Candidatus Treponema caballi]
MISASDYYKSIFGCKVYKLSLDADCTCPTRDGTKGTRGCIFCSARGSGDFAGDASESIECQVEKAKQLVASKARGRSGTAECRYIAYFQNFTSTYGDTAVLAAKYREALAVPDVTGIAIATRPDCLSDDILAEIAALAEQSPFVSIELGLQSSKPETARYIRRGYDNEVYEDAVRRIRKASSRIHIVTHIIFGLPGETESDMLDTVRYVARSPFAADGIKFTVLHVLEGTDLADEWRAGRVTCMSQEEYFAVLEKALSLLPDGMVVHRLTGDGPKKLLLAPLWTADKKRVLNELNHWVGQSLPSAHTHCGAKVSHSRSK